MAGPAPSCPDCQVPAGAKHVRGCEREVCPLCGGALAYCGCLANEAGDENALASDTDIDQAWEAFEDRRLPYDPARSPRP